MPGTYACSPGAPQALGSTLIHMANPLLFQPFMLRGLEIRNRLWVAPMCQYSVAGRDGIPREWHDQHIGGLARGGAGLVIMEATAVVPEGRISPQDIGLWSDAHTPAFARLASIAHAHGAKIGVQLAHAGRKASTYGAWPDAPEGTVPGADGGWETVGPTAERFSPAHATPRELTTSEIGEIVDAFVAAAGRAIEAGMDAVQLHAAHGYLLHEFLSPLSNKRVDAYGGSLENRARFTREVVRAVRAAYPELPIIVRVSAHEWVPGGFDADEATQLNEWLAEDGADLIDVSTGGNVDGAPITVGPSYQVPFAERVRRGPLPVGAVGLITTAAQAEAVLVTGQADVVSLARPLLANPHLPLSWAAELRAPGAAALVPPQYARARF